jgi:hypothetical protein
MTDKVDTVLNQADGILKEVEALMSSFEEKRKELVAKLEPAFADIFKPFLTKHKDAYGFIFSAYTPYFNDGEPCEYNVHDLWLIPRATQEEADENGVDLEDLQEDYFESEESTYGSYYGTLADVAAYKATGVLPKEGTDAYDNWHNQVSYQGYDYGLRKHVTKFGEQSYEKWFLSKHADVMDLSLEELQARAERDRDFSEIRKLFSRIPDDIILQLFGDHIKVVITLDGVEVREYDHD